MDENTLPKESISQDGPSSVERQGVTQRRVGHITYKQTAWSGIGADVFEHSS